MAAIEIVGAKRVFNYNGVQLPDPCETMSPEQVRDLYSATYPEIMNATVDGPKFGGDVITFDFVRAVRDKG